MLHQIKQSVREINHVLRDRVTGMGTGEKDSQCLSESLRFCLRHSSPDDADLKILLSDHLPRAGQKVSAPSERPAPGVPVDLVGATVAVRLRLRVVVAVGLRQGTRGAQVPVVRHERAPRAALLQRGARVFRGDGGDVAGKLRPRLAHSPGRVGLLSTAAAGSVSARLHRECPGEEQRKAAAQRRSEAAGRTRWQARPTGKSTQPEDTTMTEHALIYTFFLKYAPQTLGGSPVVRTSPAAVIVECHYPRKHNVSSLPLDPFWIPFSAVKMAEEFLYFSLKLMTDDWQFERPRYEYFLGDLINIEAIVKQYNHVPLRVYVDHCVACLSLDASSPRYAFIENHGCLVDARITGSASKFMPRVAENKVQFQLEAFRFQGADSGLLYISCHLKATSTAYAFDSEHRACSYINGWKEASGADAACGSCESPEFGAPLQPGGINVPVGGYPGSSGSLATAAGGVGSGSTSGGYWGGTGSGGSSPLSHPSRKMRDVSQSESMFSLYNILII
uniref:Zona pellucida sperm-binding protein 3 n=1 Tax=Scophthalmus maximus TaxID=52904 RepID=A0A8D3E497_SCOMX